MRISIDLRLARHGAILLLLAMLTGFVITTLPNRGAANSAHLTGLIGGYGLITLGLLWPRLALGRVWSTAGAWITAASLYLNWFGLLCKALGKVPNPPSPSYLIWDRTGSVALALAVLLSLASVLIVIVGLNKLAQPAATRDGDVLRMAQ